MIPNQVSYLESWSKELSVRADRVRCLIGGVHWLSDGYHKEAIIREFLHKYIPRNLNIERGFIRPPVDDVRCSPEIDILIADPSIHPPYFNEGGLQIVPPSSVVAHFEIKTNFTKESLEDALQCVSNTQLIVDKFGDPEKVWCGICFYELPDSRSIETISSTITETIREKAAKLLKDGSIKSLDHCNFVKLLPNCIATVSGFIAFISLVNDDSLKLRVFETNEISFACMFTDFFAFLRTSYQAASYGAFDSIIDSLPIENKLVSEFKLE